MHQIEGRGQRYAWGSTTDIPRLLGTEVTDEPYAEHWFGAHETAPSLLDGQPLDALLATSPERLGRRSREAFGDRLPYLVKLLAAARPLSIQAHPDRAQAEEGYAREDAAGIGLGEPHRTYKDTWPKPEAVIAITEFHGLAGFRDPLRTAELFDGLGVGDTLASVVGPLSKRKGPAALAEVFLDVLSLEGDRLGLVDTVVDAASEHADDDGELGEFARTALEVAEAFPQDRGVLAALLLNRFRLSPGEGVFLPPGKMHAYLRGFAVEVMANSDNVLRGGLTSKHIDVDNLLAVVDFSPAPLSQMTTRETAPGIRRYSTRADEFTVWALGPRASGDVPGTGARVVLVTDGTCVLRTGSHALSLAAGQAAFLDADDETTVELTGTAYVSGHGLG